jgi:hypothetical protein
MVKKIYKAGVIEKTKKGIVVTVFSGFASRSFKGKYLLKTI